MANETPHEMVHQSRRKPALGQATYVSTATKSDSATAVKGKSGRNPLATARTTTVITSNGWNIMTGNQTVDGTGNRTRIPLQPEPGLTGTTRELA